MKNTQLEMLKALLSEIKENNIYHEAVMKFDNESYSDNQGNHFIATMHDTEIRYNDNGFSIFDYHNEDAPVIYYQKDEILNFILGEEDAYGVPMTHYGDDYFFCKGYFEQMTALLEMLKEDLELYEQNLTTKVK